MTGLAGARRVAVVSPGRAGDFILTTGLYNAIKAAAPAAELTIVIGPRAAGLARHHPAVDRVLVFDRHPLQLLPFIVRLRDRRFDAWLDPKDHYSRNQTFLARMARADIRVGFNRPGGGPFDRTVAPPTDPHVHFAEMMLAPLDALGVPWARPPRLTLGIPPASAERANALLAERRPFEVLVNISAGLPVRYWEESKWVVLLPRLAATRSARFWLSSAPEDADAAERIAAAATEAGVELRRLPPGSLLDVAAVVQRMDAVVTVDTSIVHIAAVFDRPIVALYRDYRPDCDRFRPLSTVQEVLLSSRDGRVAEIGVDAVEAAWRRLLARLPA